MYRSYHRGGLLMGTLKEYIIHGAFVHAHNTTLHM